MDLAGIAVVGTSVVAILASLVLPFAGSSRRHLLAVAVAVALGLLTVALLVYVLASEGYTQDGRTVWQVSNLPRRLLEVVAVLLSAGATWLSWSSRRRPVLTLWVPAATVVVVLIDFVVLVSTVE